MPIFAAFRQVPPDRVAGGGMAALLRDSLQPLLYGSSFARHHPASVTTTTTAVAEASSSARLLSPTGSWSCWKWTVATMPSTRSCPPLADTTTPGPKSGCRMANSSRLPERVRAASGPR